MATNSSIMPPTGTVDWSQVKTRADALAKLRCLTAIISMELAEEELRLNRIDNLACSILRGTARLDEVRGADPAREALGGPVCQHTFDGPLAHGSAHVSAYLVGVQEQREGSPTCSKCGLSKAMHAHMENMPNG